MIEVTAAELRELMEVSTHGFGADLDAHDFLDRTFDELDFDSLSLTELWAQLNRRIGVELPGDIVEQSATPRELLTRLCQVVPK